MSVAYRKEEIVSASCAARSFGKILADLKANHKHRIAIAKNNALEAVIVSIHEYETMAEALALLEHIEIDRLVRKRKRSGSGQRISLDDLLKEQGIAV